MYLASLEEKKLSTLFNWDILRQKYNVQEGPILEKIYAGWTQQLIAGYNDK